ncbi:MAG: serine hydrolase domain-containing protein [Actinomycetes bacterium]
MTSDLPGERLDQVRPSGAVIETLRGLGEAATRHFPMPGGVIAIVDRDGLLAETSFGHADLERGTPMTPGYRFEIGSISKVMTSLLVNQLAEEGQLGLDEVVTDLLPWVDLGPRGRSITVTQLLTHTAGLVLGSDALPDEAAQVWAARQLVTAPCGAARFHYSNLGYLLLGELVRARTGQRLPDLVRDRLLAPLGMAGAIAEVTHADRSTLAPGYWPTRPDRPWAPGDPLSPAPWFEVATADGNVAATGRDMGRLVMALIGGDDHDPVGAREGRPVIAADVLDRMITTLAPGGEPVVPPDGLPPVEDSRYGMGINVERIGGHLCLTHGGGMVGYSTFVLADRTAGVGIVVLTNANGDCLAAQLLARAGHADLVGRPAGGRTPPMPDLDPTVRGLPGGADPCGAGGLGRFVPEGGGPPLEVDAPGPGVPVRVRLSGDVGHLYRLPAGRFVTDHPRLRRFHLDLWAAPEGSCWTHGDQVFRRPGTGGHPARGAGPVGTAPATPGDDPLVGHYRSYSPWYPELRIIRRTGRLLLVAPGGVEASGEEEELVEVSAGVLRIGADPWLPERLVVGPVVNGRVISVDRDGCRYSRAFTP